MDEMEELKKEDLFSALVCRQNELARGAEGAGVDGRVDGGGDRGHDGEGDVCEPGDEHGVVELRPEHRGLCLEPGPVVALSE